MPSSRLIARGHELAEAIAARRWPVAECLATELAREIDVMPACGPNGVCQSRDGMFRQGWQQYQASPTSTRRAIDHYNAALAAFDDRRRSR